MVKRPFRSMPCKSAFGFLTVTKGITRQSGKCLFVGTRSDFGANRQDCQTWTMGECQPAEFKRHGTLAEPKRSGK